MAIAVSIDNGNTWWQLQGARATDGELTASVRDLESQRERFVEVTPLEGDQSQTLWVRASAITIVRHV